MSAVMVCEHKTGVEQYRFCCSHIDFLSFIFYVFMLWCSDVKDCFTFLWFFVVIKFWMETFEVMATGLLFVGICRLKKVCNLFFWTYKLVAYSRTGFYLGRLILAVKAIPDWRTWFVFRSCHFYELSYQNQTVFDILFQASSI